MSQTVRTVPQRRLVPKRKLGRELRRLRERSGKTLDEIVAGVPGLTRSTLLRWESGSVSPTPEILADLLSFYEVTEQKHAELLNLRRGAGVPEWLKELSGEITPDYAELIAFELEASVLRCFEPVLIPGLLQLPEYVTALVRSGLPNATDAEISSRLTARAKRQTAFFERGAKLTVIIHEGALHCVVGGFQVMYAQLRKLVEIAEMPNVTMRVLPFAAGAFGGGMSSGCEILSFPDPADPELVYLESADRQELREGEKQLAGYRNLFRSLEKQALTPNQSLDVIDDRLWSFGGRNKSWALTA